MAAVIVSSGRKLSSVHTRDTRCEHRRSARCNQLPHQPKEWGEVDRS